MSENERNKLERTLYEEMGEEVAYVTDYRREGPGRPVAWPGETVVFKVKGGAFRVKVIEDEELDVATEGGLMVVLPQVSNVVHIKVKER